MVGSLNFPSIQRSWSVSMTNFWGFDVGVPLSKGGPSMKKPFAKEYNEEEQEATKAAWWEELGKAEAITTPGKKYIN